MNRTWVSARGPGDGGVGVDDAGGGEKSFSVMQWNILAQTLAVNGNFQFATEEVLDWERRKDLIVKVIDIIQFIKCSNRNDFIEGDTQT